MYPIGRPRAAEQESHPWCCRFAHLPRHNGISVLKKDPFSRQFSISADFGNSSTDSPLNKSNLEVDPVLQSHTNRRLRARSFRITHKNRGVPKEFVQGFDFFEISRPKISSQIVPGLKNFWSFLITFFGRVIVRVELGPRWEKPLPIDSIGPKQHRFTVYFELRLLSLPLKKKNENVRTFSKIFENVRTFFSDVDFRWFLEIWSATKLMKELDWAPLTWWTISGGINNHDRPLFGTLVTT